LFDGFNGVTVAPRFPRFVFSDTVPGAVVVFVLNFRPFMRDS
jgi:hypothetical protein